jgi:hypothetical protein
MSDEVDILDTENSFSKKDEIFEVIAKPVRVKLTYLGRYR